MRDIDQWLAQYGESHRNPVNKAIHRVAVPIIAVDMIGFAHLMPTGAIGLPPLSWIAVGAALAFYARLSPRLALGMTLVALPALPLLDIGLAALGAMALPVLIAVFAGAWAAQFVGHALEGRKPSFFADLQFLLIGPLWLLADLYAHFGWWSQSLRSGDSSIVRGSHAHAAEGSPVHSQ